MSKREPDATPGTPPGLGPRPPSPVRARGQREAAPVPSPPSPLTGGSGEPRRAGRGSEGLERRVVFGLIAATLLLASLPYLLGAYSTPDGMRFIGTAYNIDDFCNYLSWIRQTADGHFFFHNLFTTDPQKDLEFSVFFWALGRGVHWLHLSPQGAWHLARVGGGLALLWLTYRFYRHCLPGEDDRGARLTALGFACLGSGFGWTTWALWQDKNSPGSPTDAWQPEAYTFLSLYTSGLFVVSTLLILGALFALLKGEETGRWRFPVIAGVCGAILGNMHSYDVLHVAVAWGLFLLVWTLLQRGRGVALSWLRGILALAITAPTTLYQLYIFNAEATFHKRANVPTLAPRQAISLPGLHLHLRVPVLPYAFGYGLVFLLAVVGIIWLWRKRPAAAPPEDAPVARPHLRPLLFAACWAVGGFVAAYLPFAFQRKMLMGTHIPLCLLAGVGAAALVRGLKPPLRAAALSLLVLASFPSNALFLSRDINHVIANRSETGLQPYLPDTVYYAYGWIRRNVPARQGGVLSFPTLAAPLPGATGRVVWVGHWAETPAYGKKIIAFSRFADAATPDDQRLAFLRSIPATYLLYPNDVSHMDYADAHGILHHYADFAHQTPPYLNLAYANKDFTVFRIKR